MDGDFPKFLVARHENRIFVVHTHKPRFVAELLVSGSWSRGFYKLDPQFIDERHSAEEEALLIHQASAYYQSTLNLEPRENRLATVRTKKGEP